MPWKETCVMDEKKSFIEAHLLGEESMSHLCRAYGISRPTGYKWVKQFMESGMNGLADRSRAPRHHPNAVAPRIVQWIVEARARHPRWGPVTLLEVLRRDHASAKLPAPSTAGEILKRYGLSHPRSKRRRAPPHAEPFKEVQAPNSVWCADFKGWFRTGDGARIDPLTLTDAHSRFLLRCQAVAPAGFDQVRPLFEAAFRQYGLPQAIRTDNGAPFASIAIGGLSRLSAWWIKLGITPERIAPGKPQQNGRHERMHLTLKNETAQPPAANARAQQRRFDAFREEFNRVRPHRALGMKTPASVFESSPRPFPERLPQIGYPETMTVRRVQMHGEITLEWRKYFVSEVLYGERVGLEAVDDGLWRLYFGHVALGWLDERKKKVIRKGEGSMEK